jgi:hypothetical protein
MVAANPTRRRAFHQVTGDFVVSSGDASPLRTAPAQLGERDWSDSLA